MATPVQLKTPTDIESNAIRSISEALNAILADSYALFLKTKNFHWHVSGPHFRDYHLMLDEQAAQILGFVNALVHAKDAWASMPAALILSVIVALLAVAATWLGFATLRNGGVK